MSVPDPYSATNARARQTDFRSSRHTKSRQTVKTQANSDPLPNRIIPTTTRTWSLYTARRIANR